MILLGRIRVRSMLTVRLIALMATDLLFYEFLRVVFTRTSPVFVFMVTSWETPRCMYRCLTVLRLVVDAGFSLCTLFSIV